MKTISKIWFEGDWIYALGDDGKTYRQSLLWYNKLRKATDEQRGKYEISTIGMTLTKTSVSKVSFIQIPSPPASSTSSLRIRKST